MKKNLLILLFTTFLNTTLIAQTDDSVLFRVTSFIVNGENYDDEALDKGIVLMISHDKEGKAIFTNYWINEDTFSTGNMYDIKYNQTESNINNYASHTTSFIWRYTNSYDSDKGSCAVTLQRIFTETMIKFTCIIKGITNNHEVILQGYQV